jgi:hypothetical protein
MFWAKILMVLIVGLSLAAPGGALDVCSLPNKDGMDVLRKAHFAKLPPEKRGNAFRVLSTNYKGFPEALGDANDEPEYQSNFGRLIRDLFVDVCAEKAVASERVEVERPSKVPDQQPRQIQTESQPSDTDFKMQCLTGSLIFFVTTTILLSLYIVCLKFPKNPVCRFLIAATHFFVFNLVRIFSCLSCILCCAYRCFRPPPQGQSSPQPPSGSSLVPPSPQKQPEFQFADDAGQRLAAALQALLKKPEEPASTSSPA